jgi:hypothetical protein
VTVQHVENVGRPRDPAVVTDHEFVPRAEPWTVCRGCGLGEAAHLASYEPRLKTAPFSDEAVTHVATVLTGYRAHLHATYGR